MENALLKTSAEGRMVKMLANTKPLGPLSSGGPPAPLRGKRRRLSIELPQGSDGATAPTTPSRR